MEKTLEQPPLTREELLKAIYASFNHPEPLAAMIGVAKGFLVSGYDREQMKKDLGEYGLQLRAKGKNEEEGFILDLIDCIHGYCHPSSKI